ncbi:MAG: hypothetical protein AB2697_16160 [Candidatus Thiodiazotropha endolucinida]
MEIVLAVLLLFGGFALGSASVDKESDDPQSERPTSRVQGMVDSFPDTAESGCRFDKSGMYRDLTVPYIVQRDQAAPKADTCEGEWTDE